MISLQTMPDRPQRRLRAVGDVEFPEDVADVGLDGVDAQVERGRDGFIIQGV
jgi:hypothetical protein